MIVEASLVGMLLAMVALAAPPDPHHDVAGDLLIIVVSATVFLGLQALVLLPVWRPKARSKRGVPVIVSLTAAALVVAVLVGGFAAALHDAIRARGAPDTYARTGLLVALVAWPIGTLLFVGYARSRRSDSREELLSRVTRGILKGTAFEALAVLPLDLMIRRKHDCYCVAGSVLAWAICVALGVLVFGPAALLPALSKARDDWYRERCDSCGARRASAALADGYRGPTAEVCGRCGAAQNVTEAD